MGDFRFLWDNRFDLAALLASSEAAGFDVGRIQHEWFLKAWRSTGLTAETVDADLGAPEDVWAFFAYYLNLRDTADFRIQADADPAYGSLDVDDLIPISAEMAALGIVGKFWAAAQAFRYWRQLFTDDETGHPEGYIFEGRAFLGPYFQPKYNPSISPIVTDVDPSEILVTPGGQKTLNAEPQFSRIEYRWGSLPTSDIVLFREMFAAVGKTPFFIVEDSDEPISSLRYARIVEDPTYGAVSYGCRSLSLVVETER